MQPGQSHFHFRILVVDDDEDVRLTLVELLKAEGHDVLTASDGFEALAVMREALPHLIISDLKMPNMSGFELLGVVRKRFPSIAVIAISAEFTPVSVPPDLLADRYLEKGQAPPLEIVEIVRELLAASPLRSQPARSTLAPVWVPRSHTGYVVLTCPHCLRSFSVRHREVSSGSRSDETCLHCGSQVQYYLDPNTLAARPPVSAVTSLRVDLTKKIIESSQDTIKDSHQLMEQNKRKRG